MYELSFQDPFDSPRSQSQDYTSRNSRRSDSEAQALSSCHQKLQKSLTQTVNYSHLNLFTKSKAEEQQILSSSKEKSLSDETILHKLSFLDIEGGSEEFVNVSHLSPKGGKTINLETTPNNSPNKSINESMTGEIFLKTVPNSSNLISSEKKRNVNIDTFIDQIIKNSESIKQGVEIQGFDQGLIKFIDSLTQDLNSLEYKKEGLWVICCYKLTQFEKILKLKIESLNKMKKIQIFTEIGKVRECESWVFSQSMTLVDLCLMGDILSTGFLLEKEIRLIDIYEVVEQFTTYFFNRVTTRYSKAKTRRIDPRYFFYNIRMFLLQEL
jgi:hypothetical protein